jgi:hypothetical protein
MHYILRMKYAMVNNMVIQLSRQANKTANSYAIDVISKLIPIIAKGNVALIERAVSRLRHELVIQQVNQNGDKIALLTRLIAVIEAAIYV